MTICVKYNEKESLGTFKLEMCTKRTRNPQKPLNILYCWIAESNGVERIYVILLAAKTSIVHIIGHKLLHLWTFIMYNNEYFVFVSFWRKSRN